jgi:flagellum-specific peptidoglycan hydrolase FlgJ
MNTIYLPCFGLMALLFAVVPTDIFGQKKSLAHVSYVKNNTPATFNSVAQMVSDSFGAPVELIEEFIREAKALEKDEGIPATAFIGIAILESTGFTSYLYKQALNPFGMRATKIWQGPTFVMFHEGADSPFRKYDSPRQAVRDFNSFLEKRRWFNDAIQCPPTDIEYFLSGMSANKTKKEPGYASDPEWPNKVRRVIKTYKLDKI